MTTIDKYALVSLKVAILTQAIIDAYKGSKKIKKEAIAFLNDSEEFKELISDLIILGVKANHLLGIETFSNISRIIKQNKGIEFLYKNCKTVPLIEHGDDWDKYITAKKNYKTEFIPATKKKLKHIHGVYQVVL